MVPQEATIFFLKIIGLTSGALALELSSDMNKALAEFQEIVTPGCEAAAL
jgi:hypothetical protein